VVPFKKEELKGVVGCDRDSVLGANMEDLTEADRAIADLQSDAPDNADKAPELEHCTAHALLEGVAISERVGAFASDVEVPAPRDRPVEDVDLRLVGHDVECCRHQGTS
jgi:hypothetical protein